MPLPLWSLQLWWCTGKWRCAVYKSPFAHIHFRTVPMKQTLRDEKFSRTDGVMNEHTDTCWHPSDGLVQVIGRRAFWRGAAAVVCVRHQNLDHHLVQFSPCSVARFFFCYTPRCSSPPSHSNQLPSSSRFQPWNFSVYIVLRYTLFSPTLRPTTGIVEFLFLKLILLLPRLCRCQMNLAHFRRTWYPLRLFTVCLSSILIATCLLL